MLLYHGSNRIFKEFKISEELAITNKDNLVEGYGVYMTDDKSFAKNHGNNVYTIDVSNSLISDFTDKQYILSLLNKIEKDVDICFNDYFDIDSLIESTLSGKILITKFYKEIVDLLDSTELFWQDFGNKITYEDDCIFKKIENSFYNNISSIYKYYDNSYKKNIFICVKNEENLKIISIDEMN